MTSGPHLKTFRRIILPFIFNAVIGLTNFIDFCYVFLNSLLIPIDFNEEEASHSIGDVESHGFIDHIDRHFVQNLTGRESDA